VLRVVKPATIADVDSQQGQAPGAPPARGGRPGNAFRNVAIVAHVDHGKTTLVDAMLRQSGALHERGEAVERVLDTGDLEREKGITILAKNTAVHRHHPDGSVTVINVIDTPGHADFGGEVERGLSMVDGVLLLVDASEGPLPQTRFVLRKALIAHLPVILVVNKTDRPDARITEVVEASHDLLLDVATDLDVEAAAAAERALSIPTLYASGRAGVASTVAPANGTIPEGANLDALFDVLLEHVPPPSGDAEAPLQALVTNLDASAFLGRLALVRIYNGRLRKGQTVAWLREVDREPVVTSARITELLATEGVERFSTDGAVAGDIVAVAGLPDIMIGDTLADPEHPRALPRITVDEPAISVTIGTNTSPLAGRVPGHKLTARLVRVRLDAELVGNVSIRVVDIDRPDAWEVQGRGELALAVLVEQMRREGFELTVGKPQVVTKTIDGVLHEPYEALTIDCPEEFVGAITRLMAARKGRIAEMANHAVGWVRMDFAIPSRGLIGWRTEFLTETRGTGIAHAVFDGYRPWAGEIRARHSGSLVSDRAGVVTPFALLQLADRGTFFVEPGQETYEGMVVGINPRAEDLDINVTREKKLTNMRSSTADVIETLAKPLDLDLEQAMEFCAPDECVEATPEIVRVRKVELDATSRARMRARAKAAAR
jgi:GTP-binding protein